MKNLIVWTGLICVALAMVGCAKSEVSESDVKKYEAGSVEKTDGQPSVQTER